MRPAHGGNLAWAAELAGCSPNALMDFSASINPLGPPKNAIAAIIAALGSLSHYPDPDYRELKTALGNLHQLPPEWILPGNGSAELLTWAAWDLAELSTTALVTPSFGDYRRALSAFNAKVVEWPLLRATGASEAGEVGGAEGAEEENSSPIPPSPLPRSCQEAAQEAAPSNSGLLINNPHNPTGYLFLRETILSYLEQFALVVVDEAFMDFLPPDREQSLISVVQKYPNLVILRSLTKFYSMPGLRLGYAIAHPTRLQRWQNRRDPWPVNTLAVAAAQAAIQDTDFQQQTWTWLITARLELFQALVKIPGLQPRQSAANFLLVKSQQPSSQIQQQLLKKHQILIRDCLSFPELGEGYFRVAVRSKSENEHLIKALTNLEIES